MSRTFHPQAFEVPPGLDDDSNQRLVLGALLEDSAGTIAATGGAIDPALFPSYPCAAILAAIVALLEEGAPINVFTLTQKLRDRGELENVGGPAEVTHLVTKYACPVEAVGYYLEQLRQDAALRLGLETGAWLSEVSGAGGTAPAEIVAGMMDRLDRIQALQDAGQAAASPLGTLADAESERDKTLLGRRYLCRGGGALLVGPTGIGKSSFSMQAMTSWALGHSCFGIAPARPLRSLLIQAENDDGDMAEMRDGVFAGLNLSAAERERAGEMILCFHEDRRSGEEFFARTVEPLLRQHRPDLLWIDPALSYIGGESNSQADVGRFLRNWLNPLLTRYGCAAVVVHHTNKPPSGKEKSEWTGSDLAYLGSGSAEWANWARAVVAIRGLGENGVFELCLGKRGGRVGWQDEAGAPVYKTLIGHAKEPGRICWRNADESERPDGEKGHGRQETFSAAELLEILSDGAKSFSEWFSAAEGHGWTRTTFRRRLDSMAKAKQIHKSMLDGKYYSGKLP